ncbi:hypothetical protein SAMN05444339_1075 [Loktanella atrilutea]|uniref:Uncharacterized protein n=1 Tax=Loktanella atrilutea TaxID=366533 RepID=A0A1M5C4A8_LOKAT|nr:hypothetical protein [Loktanella atrilutea]SHF49603.1 hypothetical protein SAMN05444339_1075 [Loktanella atrilutea]
MTVARLGLIAGVWVLALPAFAAGSDPAVDHAPAAAADTADPTAPPLPTSMQRHGIAGHVPPPEGIAILDPAILAAMRSRLVIYAREPEE